jgi:hypothetical protein
MRMGEGASEACFDGRGGEAPVLDSDSIVVEDGGLWVKACFIERLPRKSGSQ